MKKILVPCDFSTPAREAFKFAVDIAMRSKGSIHVLHVIDMTYMRGYPTLSNAYAFNVRFLQDVENEVTQKFQVMRGYAPITMDIKFSHVLGSLTWEIEKQVHDRDIDLVVMGTHGEGNAGFGSNTEKIVRNAPVPVLTLKSAPGSIKNIALPVLPGRIDADFVSGVKNLQAFFGATLHLLYVNTPLFFRGDNESALELENFAKKHFADCTTSIRSDYTVEAGIRHFCNEVGADMVAIGTNAWKGIAHFFVGSTAEDIANHFPIPVWTKSLR